MHFFAQDEIMMDLAHYSVYVYNEIGVTAWLNIPAAPPGARQSLQPGRSSWPRHPPFPEGWTPSTPSKLTNHIWSNITEIIKRNCSLIPSSNSTCNVKALRYPFLPLPLYLWNPSVAPTDTYLSQSLLMLYTFPKLLSFCSGVRYPQGPREPN